MLKILRDIFKPRHTPYRLLKTIYVAEHERQMVEDTRFSGGHGISDELDVMYVPTGRLILRAYDLYERHSIRTGLPSYKRIRREDLDETK